MTLEREGEILINEVSLPRTENPLFSALIAERAHFVRFRNIVNRQLQLNHANPIATPRIERIQLNRFIKKPLVLIDIPIPNYNQKKEESLKRLLTTMNSYGKEDDDFETDEDAPIVAVDKNYKDLFLLTTSLDKDENPYHTPGIMIKGRNNKYPDRSGFVTAIINNGEDSETILAYQNVISALIAQGRLDMSTDEAEYRSLPLRKGIFMNIYHEMLAQKEPFVRREDIFDLDEQIDDIDTDLYRPLRKGRGNPMNTLLVGAPGVGKSIVGRFFMADKDVLTVPIGVDKLDSFGYQVLPSISRIKRMVDTPAVLLIDDIEALLGGSFTVDDSGHISQAIDPEERSEALNMLERMQDTYGIFLLCSLNHPDVEAAFLRRFNPIYFPMPDEGQRNFMLKKIIPAGPLDKSQFDTLISNISSTSNGFNYHGLARIPEYLVNLREKRPYSTPEEHVKTILEAYRKASRSMDRTSLERFDKAARKMVGLEGN